MKTNNALSVGSALSSLIVAVGYYSTQVNGFLIPPVAIPTRFGITPTTPSSSTTTSIQMGIMEDFMSGKDDSIRENANEEYITALNKRVDSINNMEAVIEELEDEDLVAKSVEFRKRLSEGEDINGKILEEAFAVVREAAWRVLELRHYDVQLLGGLILHDGRLAEMATGEGKTLVSTLPCYINALTGKSAFIITVNDYLAKRDMEKMGQIYRFLGLTVGLVQSSMKEDERRVAYGCDVVYVTNSELGFDYLRDNLALGPDQTVLPNSRGSGVGSGTPGEFDGFCVVDEADSVLIDEARTPLIISKQIPAPASKYEVAQTLADALFGRIHYDIDIKNKNVILNEKGYRDCENALGIQSLFALPEDGTGAWAPFVINAVKAKELFEKDVEYSVLLDDTGKKIGVGIIDAFTGRVLEGRRWSDGLHQSIEAMEGIEVSQQSKVIAKVTYQALFRQFTRLSGMTGTAMSDASELSLTYDLTVTPVPTALPIARRDYPDVSYKSRKAADKALINEIIAVGGGQPDGRPCLVGTTSVAQSEGIVRSLERMAGIKAELLNASPKNAPRESEIVAQAGRAGVVTVATNMAGRGTDILLGGCSGTMSRIKSRSVMVNAGIMAAEEMELLPPAPQESYFPCEISEDVAFALKDAAASVRKAVGEDLTVIGLDEILTVATDTTEAEDDPEHIVKLRNAIGAVREAYQEVLSVEKDAVIQKGGLYVMGTNRHESSRIDGQLRGRAGRQGDPGSSRFFLSFEDDMFVVFGGDGLKKILETFRVSEDMPVEAPQVTEALNKVQLAVEENYRDIREQILQFDVVLNDQRRVIYKRRQGVLFSSLEDTIGMVEEYNELTVKDIVNGQTGDDGVVDVIKVLEKIGQFFPPVAPLITAEDVKGLDSQGVATFISVAVDEVFKAKTQELEVKAKKDGRPAMSLARSANYIVLVTMDNAWSDHLQMMEDLKEAVVLRKYQNLDPVAEYKNEAFEIFQTLDAKMRCNAIFSLWQSI